VRLLLELLILLVIAGGVWTVARLLAGATRRQLPGRTTAPQQARWRVGTRSAGSGDLQVVLELAHGDTVYDEVTIGPVLSGSQGLTADQGEDYTSVMAVARDRAREMNEDRGRLT
jgi:hypothetical protein